MKPDERRQAARENPGMPRAPQLTNAAFDDSSAHDALPLATTAPVRLFAWPDYADESELDVLFVTFARELAGRHDVALCLRHDALLDGPLEAVCEALRAAHSRALAEAAPLDLLLVDDELAPGDWARLARALHGAIVLPSARRAPRSVALAALFVAGVTRISTAADLVQFACGPARHDFHPSRFTRAPAAG